MQGVDAAAQTIAQVNMAARAAAACCCRLLLPCS